MDQTPAKQGWPTLPWALPEVPSHSGRERPETEGTSQHCRRLLLLLTTHHLAVQVLLPPTDYGDYAASYRPASSSLAAGSQTPRPHLH